MFCRVLYMSFEHGVRVIRRLMSDSPVNLIWNLFPRLDRTNRDQYQHLEEGDDDMEECPLGPFGCFYSPCCLRFMVSSEEKQLLYSSFAMNDLEDRSTGSDRVPIFEGITFHQWLVDIEMHAGLGTL